jgi:N-methylhydantoinase A
LGKAEAISLLFHKEHERMYGYSLESEGAAIELINVRVRAVGLTEKPSYPEESYAGKDCTAAIKGERPAYIPEENKFRHVTVYDGHKTGYGNCISGPALIEQTNTTLFLSGSYDCICDKYGSFAVYRKGCEASLAPALREALI